MYKNILTFAENMWRNHHSYITDQVKSGLTKYDPTTRFWEAGRSLQQIRKKNYLVIFRIDKNHDLKKNQNNQIFFI